ncbi:diguanylate cyclase [Rudaea sp.]|uniref:GGDEF domain-containing protein n=1 Tax=Rudaea sp. TaxID=2136325 RepID=UPI00321F8BCF
MSPTVLPIVLIVDNDSINRSLLAELMQNDCRIIMAGDGESAIARAREEPDIDLILLDVSMPQMDGYEVMKELRQEPHTAATAVIFITAATETGSEEFGLSLGAIDYLHKPIRPAIVQARVRNHLKFVAQRKELERLADRDGLTSIANRRHFDLILERAWWRATRTGESLNLAMIDVDHFKRYNDRHGHSAGDEALRRIAQVLARTARRTHEVAARYGGDEFVLLLSAGTDLESMLEQARSEVAALNLARAGSDRRSVVTISCGGVTADVNCTPSPAALLRQADVLLYKAKRQGRNRVVVQRCTPPPEANSC